MNWYYAIGGRSRGPLSEGGLRQLAREGVVLPDTLVWHPGLEKWDRLGTLEPELLERASEDAAPRPEAGETGPVPPPERNVAKAAGAGILGRLFGRGKKSPER